MSGSGNTLNLALKRRLSEGRAREQEKYDSQTHERTITDATGEASDEASRRPDRTNRISITSILWGTPARLGNLESSEICPQLPTRPTRQALNLYVKPIRTSRIQVVNNQRVMTLMQRTEVKVACVVGFRFLYERHIASRLDRCPVTNRVTIQRALWRMNACLRTEVDPALLRRPSREAA